MQTGLVNNKYYCYETQEVSNNQQQNQLQISLDYPKDSIELSTKTPKTKNILTQIWEYLGAARPNFITYKKYGGLKKIETISEKHHKKRSIYKYLELPAGTNVKTEYGIVKIKENQVAILDNNNNFYIEDIEYLIKNEKIEYDEGNIKIFANKLAQAQKKAEQDMQPKLIQN